MTKTDFDLMGCPPDPKYQILAPFVHIPGFAGRGDIARVRRTGTYHFLSGDMSRRISAEIAEPAINGQFLN